MVISLKQVLRPVTGILILIILFMSFSIVTRHKRSEAVYNANHGIEIFDITKERVVKEVPSTSETQREVKNCLEGITNIYAKFNPIPPKGFMIKVFLEPPVRIHNQWLNSRIDEVIILFPEGASPYLMVFEDGNKPLFLTFRGNTSALLKSLDFQPECGAKEDNFSEPMVFNRFTTLSFPLYLSPYSTDSSHEPKTAPGVLHHKFHLFDSSHRHLLQNTATCL